MKKLPPQTAPVRAIPKKSRLTRMLAIACGLSATAALHAANYTTTAAATSNNSWNTVNAGWTSGAGAVAGNTYEAQSGALVRSDDTNAPTVTFPGDSLTIDSGAALRFKAYNPSARGNTTINFSKAGLILAGGQLQAGDAVATTVGGFLHVNAASSLTTSGPGTVLDTPGHPATDTRTFNFTASIDGSGQLTLMNGKTSISNPASQGAADFSLTGNNSLFNGSFNDVGGWLQVSGIISLGSGNVIINGTANNQSLFSSTIPLVSRGTLTVGNSSDTVDSGVFLTNSLTFSAVTFNGISLTNGTYSALQINAITGQFNVNDPTGTNTLTVGQVAFTAPSISAQPQPEMVFSAGVAKFTVAATSLFNESLLYAWQKNGTTLNNNAPHVTGATNATLVISNVSSADVASYRVIVTGGSSLLSTTSAAVSLTVTVPNAYDVAAVAVNPVALYAFNETNDLSAGGALCFDSVGGFNGVAGTSVQNAFNGVAGPRSTDGYPYFPGTNTAALLTHNNGASVITLPPLNLNTNAVTLSAWIYPTEIESGSRGIIFCRSGSTVAGLSYNSALVNGDYQLGYNWANLGNTFNFQSGLFVPQNQWSLVAVSISATNACLYVINTNGIQTATNAFSNAIESFSGSTLIGDDSSDGGNGARVFGGAIDEVAIFNSSLTQPQLLALFASASGVSVFPPRIVSQPLPAASYAGGTAVFTVTGAGSAAIYQWYKGSVALTNGSTSSGSIIAGAVNSTALTINNVASGDIGNYTVVLTNSAGSVTGSPAALTIVVPNGDAYETAVLAAHPLDFYELNETADPAAGGVEAFDYQGGNNGIYGASVFNGNANYGIAGPRPTDGFIGFSATNMAAQFPFDAASGTITTPGWNLNTNTVTITAWVNPNSLIYDAYGIIMCRNGSASALGGLNFSAAVDPNNGYHYLSYDWADNAATTNWASGLEVPVGQWSFVAVSVTASNATLYLINANGLATAVNTFAHVPTAFNAPVTIGGDPFDRGTGLRNFPGIIDNVAIFKNSLTQGQLVALYAAAAGNSNFPPLISLSPTNRTLFQGQAAQFSVVASGSPTLQYQWAAAAQGSGGPYTNLANVGQFSGAQSATLTINNVDLPNVLDYVVVVTNLYGSATSAPATMTVNIPPPPSNLTLNYGGAPLIQGQNTNWDTASQWSDGNPASTSAASSPFNTYEVQANSVLRSPTTTATFPGITLTIDGNGTFNSTFTNGGNSTVGEIRLKATPMTFPRLVMLGGQLDISVGALQAAVINGEMDIMANTPFYNDSGNDQGFIINAYLAGTGAIELRDQGYAPTNGITMNITGNTNTYSGTWNVIQGALLGTGVKALGTNNITVGTTGTLETTYDLNNPKGGLVLNGQMLLHQNDTFNTVVVQGNSLPNGTYSAATLASAYPASFPLVWRLQSGSSLTNASGSLTIVGGGAATPPVLGTSLNGSSLVLTWTNAGLGLLQVATNLTGPWVPVAGASSPYTNAVSPTVPARFFRLQAQ